MSGLLLGRAGRLALWLALAAVLLSAAATSANAPPPPTTVWLTFADQAARPATPEGVQIIACESPACERATLLQQYGECRGEGCLAAAPTGLPAQAPECLGNRCLFRFHLAAEEPTAVKVVGQFSDGVRSSPIIPVDSLRFRTVAWRVIVRDADLAVSDDPDHRNPSAAYDDFFSRFALTVAAELAVAAIALGVWLKRRRADLLRGLAYVLLVNLVAYPVTWSLWPSLGQFQPEAMRRTGYFLAALAAVFAALLVLAARSEGRRRRLWIILTVVLMALAALLSLVWLFLASYGDPRIAVQGLPWGVTIILAEVFAIVFEAGLIYLLARRTLSLALREVALLSLAMNLASALLGWLVMGI